MTASQLLRFHKSGFRIVERGGRFYPQHRWCFIWCDFHGAKHEVGDEVLVVPGPASFGAMEHAVAYLDEIEKQ